MFRKDLQFYKFCAYGFFKNLRFFDAFIILFFVENGFSFLQIGFLFSVREIVVNLTEILTGYFADYFGRKKAMLISFSSYILGFAVFYFQGNLYLMAIIAMMLLGLGDTFRSGTHKAMILEYLKIHNWEEYKVEYYGYTRSWSQIGSALSSLIAAAMVVLHGSVKIVFLASIIPYLLDFLLILSYPSALDGGKKPARFAGKAFLKNMIEDFLNIPKRKSVRRVMVNTAAANAIFKAAKDYIQPMIKQSIIYMPLFAAVDNEVRSVLLIGLSYFIIYMVGAYSSRNASKFLRHFQDLYTSLNLLYIGFTIILFVLGVTAQFHWILFGIVLFLLLHIFQNLEKPIMVSAIADTQEHSLMATALSVQNQIRSIMTALLAPLLGYMIDLFDLAGGFSIIGMLLLLLYPLMRLQRN